MLSEVLSFTHTRMYAHLSAVTSSLGRAQPMPGIGRKQLLMRNTDYQCNSSPDDTNEESIPQLKEERK